MFSSLQNSMPMIKAILILSLFSLVLCQPSIIVSSNTNITVCLTGLHTFVSDLRFYLIGPPSCNSPNISLYRRPDNCGNPGDNINNLCFSSGSTSNFNICGAATPLNGTYGLANGIPIAWSGLYGCNAAENGWKLQILDCAGGDGGSLTGTSLLFNSNGFEILYESGAINLNIMAYACAVDTAVTFNFQGFISRCTIDNNGNAQVLSMDGNSCILDCSVIQGCSQCTATPNTVCTVCLPDSNENVQAPSQDGTSCILDCSVIQGCTQCTASPNTVCTQCGLDTFGNPQVPSSDSSQCISPCQIQDCIACQFSGTINEKCTQCSSNSNGKLQIPAPSGKRCIKDPMQARGCRSNCRLCVGTIDFCIRCKSGFKLLKNGRCRRK